MQSCRRKLAPLSLLSDPLLIALLEGKANDLPLSSSAKRRKLEEAAESSPALLQKLDTALWTWRQQELAEEGVPVTLGQLKRTRLLDSDRISTTWDSWELASGKRHATRVLRPSIRKDPIWRRRLARGARVATDLPGILPLSSDTQGDWPHIWVPVDGLTLFDLLPAEDLPDALYLARFLAGGLKGLKSLHDNGLVHGQLSSKKLVLTANGVGLIWLDPFLEEEGSPQQDLKALGEAVAQLDPQAIDPVGSLAHAWAEEPPPNSEMAAGILKRTLANHLAESRHRLLMRSRHLSAREGEARLLRAVRALSGSLAPPATQVCLRAGMDSVLVVAKSDGTRVEGVGLAGLPMRFLPEIWSPEKGLDASASRMLLRSFATRRTGDESRRAEIQAELGATDLQAEQLCRWLSAQARLRATAKLLELGRKGL